MHAEKPVSHGRKHNQPGESVGESTVPESTTKLPGPPPQPIRHPNIETGPSNANGIVPGQSDGHFVPDCRGLRDVRVERLQPQDRAKPAPDEIRCKRRG